MRSLRTPNFFIVGAPKCGTNALYRYLKEHPKVFMPEAKEPQHFCHDFPGVIQVRSFEDYCALFAPVTTEVAVGEASVWYLYSQVAIKRIINMQAKAKIVAILRNPIDVAHSLHSQFLRMSKENQADFERAWDLQENRRYGRALPKYCPEPRHLQYKDVCSFGRQIARVQQIVPAEQLHVIIYEEFFSDPETHYKRLLTFLEVPFVKLPEFTVENENRVIRSRGLLIATRGLTAALPGNLAMWKRALNKIGIRPLRLLSRYNAVAGVRPRLSAEFRRRLVDEFAPDRERLERLLGRPLACWAEGVGPDSSGAAVGGFRICDSASWRIS